jgi:hypothetical protein
MSPRPFRTADRFTVTAVVGLLAVGIAAGVGHLGIALALAFVAPVPATAAELKRRRRAGGGTLAALRALPITVLQQWVFTAWFLYTGFLALAVIVGAIGGGIRALAG